ncbi:MAG TPA: hypothetical protein VIO32_08740 [Candidatus Baltobacteraceae bacterium]
MAVGAALGVAVGTGEGNPPGGGSDAGIPPFVLHAESAAHNAALISKPNSGASARFMAQAGYTWSIRASPARVEFPAA